MAPPKKCGIAKAGNGIIGKVEKIFLDGNGNFTGVSKAEFDKFIEKLPEPKDRPDFYNALDAALSNGTPNVKQTACIALVKDAQDGGLPSQVLSDAAYLESYVHLAEAGLPPGIRKDIVKVEALKGDLAHGTHGAALRGWFGANPTGGGAWNLAFENNFPMEWRFDIYFLGKLRNVWDYTFVNGTNSKNPNIVINPTILTKVPTVVLLQLRNVFNSSGKINFLKNLGSNPNISNMLQRAGFSNTEIPALVQRLNNGQGIPGYQVHHKVPLDLGGSNDFSNLVLMKQQPYHSAITSFHNTQINIPVGQTQTLDFPEVPGSFYSPPYIRLVRT